MTVYKYILASALAFFNKVYAIFRTPAAFAQTLQPDSGRSFYSAFRFYASVCTVSIGFWLYFLYYSGGRTVLDRLFPGLPDKGKEVYILLLVALTALPGAILYLTSKVAFGRRLTLAIFLQMFFYAAGALVMILTILALAIAASTQLFPVSPSEALETQLTIQDAANDVALCEDERSVECQVMLRSLRFGPNAYYLVAITLFLLLLYQTTITTIMLRAKLGAGLAWPILITAFLLATLVYSLTFGMELLAMVERWLPSTVGQYVVHDQCRTSVKRGEADKAVRYCEKAAELRQKPGAAFLNLCVARGQVAPERRNWGSALEACNAAVERGTENARLVRGITYSQMKEFGNAVRDFDQAIAATPTDLAPYYHRGNALLDWGRYEEAERNFDNAISMKSAVVYHSRAKARLMRGKHNEALADLNAALILDRKNADIHVTLAKVHADRGDLQSAGPALLAAKSLNPKTVSAYLIGCDISLSQKDCDEAVQMSPGNGVSYAYRAKLASKGGRYEEARVDYKIGFLLLEADILKARQKQTYKDDIAKTIKDHGNFAFMALLAGDYERALEAADAAIKLDKESSLGQEQIWLVMNKAHALAFLGRRDEAKTLYASGKGKRWGGREWDVILREDFNWLRTASHPSDEKRQEVNKFFDEIEGPRN